jgi:hypothetical protein
MDHPAKSLGMLVLVVADIVKASSLESIFFNGLV